MLVKCWWYFLLQFLDNLWKPKVEGVTPHVHSWMDILATFVTNPVHRERMNKVKMEQYNTTSPWQNVTILPVCIGVNTIAINTTLLIYLRVTASKPAAITQLTVHLQMKHLINALMKMSHMSIKQASLLEVFLGVLPLLV